VTELNKCRCTTTTIKTIDLLGCQEFIRFCTVQRWLGLRSSYFTNHIISIERTSPLAPPQCHLIVLLSTQCYCKSHHNSPPINPWFAPVASSPSYFVYRIPCSSSTCATASRIIIKYLKYFKYISRLKDLGTCRVTSSKRHLRPLNNSLI
jgi:hypothetical protein